MSVVSQPAGVVTLVFTDIEGSTRLLEELGVEAYRRALAEHRRVVRQAFARYEGYEVDYEGDAFFFAFASAQAAVDAVGEAIRGLEPGLIRIRVGIHTGEPTLDPPKYVGVDVHQAARIMSCGHGGQVVLSRAARELVEAEMLDLGEHRLKDINGPIWLFQLGDGSFPPLKSLNNTNLPAPVSSFLGRAAELAEAEEVLATGRLLTVTGPGGTGKTRFAIELAWRQLGRFPNGVFWVELAPLRDPALVVGTIAHALGAKTTLKEHVGGRRLLLLLDNLEQVIACTPDLSRLLRDCPNLALLVTSRERLRIDGEREYPLPALSGAEAVELFCDRAQAASSETIAELCSRLDHLPLAIELAAARTAVLDPAQLLDRLGQRLDFLRGGRDADPRQQTLRATIEWSYDLLHTTEQELFARFAVFPGGCTLEAAENVCDADIDLLQSLLEKSLLRRTAERYWMLETIREFAAERLADLPGASELRRRQADWLVRLARESEPALEGSADQAGWLSRLAAEVENIRAALAWARDSNAAVMLDLAGHLGLFFWLSGFIEEGLNWIETAIARDDCAQPVIRADALAAAAWLGLYGGHLDRARGHADACAALRRELGDDRGLARALREQGKARVAVEPEVARSLLEEAARVSRRTDDAWNLAIVTNNLGDLALYDGQYQRAFRLCGESLKLRKSRGDAWGAAIAGFNVGLALMALGRFEEAGVQLRETLALSVKVELTLTIAETLVGLAAVELDGGDAERATRLLGAAETLFAETEEEPFPFEAALRERTTARARSELTAEAFQSAWQHGYRARRVDTVEYALRRRSDAAGPRQMPFPSAEI